MSQDDDFMTLHRRLGEYRDVATAQRILALLVREQHELNLPRLAPDTKLVDVPHEAFGLNDSWWGRVVEHTREYFRYKAAGWPKVGIPYSWRRSDRARESAPLTVKQLAEAFNGREKIYCRLPRSGYDPRRRIQAQERVSRIARPHVRAASTKRAAATVRAVSRERVVRHERAVSRERAEPHAGSVS